MPEELILRFYFQFVRFLIKYLFIWNFIWMLFNSQLFSQLLIFYFLFPQWFSQLFDLLPFLLNQSLKISLILFNRFFYLWLWLFSLKRRWNFSFDIQYFLHQTLCIALFTKYIQSIIQLELAIHLFGYSVIVKTIIVYF